jgi:hypothetical protein
MKWITHEHVRADRVTSAWLIRRFVDPQAAFLFAPKDQVMAVAAREDAIPFDMPGVELGHHGKACSFEAIVQRYALTNNAALVLLGKIVNGADTDNSLWSQPEGPGLSALADGFLSLGLGDDQHVLASEFLVCDALYGYCQAMVERGTLNGAFKL